MLNLRKAEATAIGRESIKSYHSDFTTATAKY